MTRDRATGTLLMVLAACCWSTAGVFIRQVSAEPWAIVTWRSAILAVTLLLALVARDRLGIVRTFRALGWPGLLSAVLLATTFGLFVLAMTRTTVANTLVIMATGPFVVALLGWALLGERPSRALWATTGVVTAGVVLMVAGDLGGGSGLGNLFAFLVAVVFSLNTLLVRRYRAIDMVPAVCLGGVLSAITAAPFAVSLVVSSADLFWLSLLGTIQLSLGLALFVAATRRLAAADVSLLGSLETVLGPLWAWLALGERPTGAALLGGLVVVAALGVYPFLSAPQRGRDPTLPRAGSDGGAR